MRRAWPALAAGSVAFLGAEQPAVACQNWVAPTSFAIRQANYSLVEFSLKQDGTRLYGMARYRMDGRLIEGTVTGGFSDKQIFLRAAYARSGVPQVVVYAAAMPTNGMIGSGIAYSQSDPSLRQNWTGSIVFHCPMQITMPKPLPPGDRTCLTGYVWRDAFPGDQTCVTPERRRQAKEENRLHPDRVAPLDAQAMKMRSQCINATCGPPQSCLSGFVWREARPSDRICVTPATREQTRQENLNGHKLMLRYHIGGG